MSMFPAYSQNIISDRLLSPFIQSCGMVEVAEVELPPEKIGTAAPYFRKQSFYFRHLSFGNVNIVSHSLQIGNFFSPADFQTKHSLFYFRNRDHWF